MLKRNVFLLPVTRSECISRFPASGAEGQSYGFLEDRSVYVRFFCGAFFPCGRTVNDDTWYAFLIYRVPPEGGNQIAP